MPNTKIKKLTTQVAEQHVNGFYRYQRYGKGRNQVKQIWVDSFERGPYIRRSKKDKVKNINK